MSADMAAVGAAPAAAAAATSAAATAARQVGAHCAAATLQAAADAARSAAVLLGAGCAPVGPRRRPRIRKNRKDTCNEQHQLNHFEETKNEVQWPASPFRGDQARTPTNVPSVAGTDVSSGTDGCSGPLPLLSAASMGGVDAASPFDMREQSGRGAAPLSPGALRDEPHSSGCATGLDLVGARGSFTTKGIAQDAVDKGAIDGRIVVSANVPVTVMAEDEFPAAKVSVHCSALRSMTEADLSAIARSDDIERTEYIVSAREELLRRWGMAST